MPRMPQKLEGAVKVPDLEVREYIEQLDPQKVPLFSHKTLCDSWKGLWLQTPNKINTKEIYSECLEAQLKLVTRVNRYLEKSKQPPMIFETSGDWEAVKCQMEKACVVLDSILLKKKKTRGLTGAIRRGFDVLCRNAATGKALVSCVPSDLMIASAVSGGLKVIFFGLEQHCMYEESVLKALEGLPEILNANERYSKIAVEDSEIHRLTAKLYARVCEVLDYILRWMMDNLIVSGVIQMFKPGRYAKDLNDKMAEVRLAAQALEKRATTLLLQGHKNMLNRQDGMCLQQLEIGEQMENLHYKVDQLSSKLDRVEELELLVPNLLNSFQSVLNEEWHQIHRDHDIRKSRSKQLASSKVTADDVLRQLLFDPDLVFEDMDYLLQQGTSGFHKMIQPRRLLAIQQSPRIKAWLSLDSHSLLLLNGNSPSHLDTSTSFFSAKVMSTLMQQSLQVHRSIKLIPLGYFCGQHQNYHTDVYASPAELAMSLLLQLVNANGDFGPEILQSCLDETDPDDLGSILKSLARLLHNTPLETVVFVIIDGVEHFTRPDDRRGGLREIFIQLVHMFREQQGAKLKLLFTSTQKAVMLERLGLIMDNEIVNIPNSPPP